LKSNRSGGQKGRGLESECPPGIFTRPRFSAAEFRASETGAPPQKHFYLIRNTIY